MKKRTRFFESHLEKMSLVAQTVVGGRNLSVDPHPEGLYSVFESINERHFEGRLIPTCMRWNSRIRSAAGRFIPGSRFFFLNDPPVIEVATYLLELEQAPAYIEDTVGHEMIHYWLWTQGKPYGHTVEFREKMRQMGVSRYNSVPRSPLRHVYLCPHCSKEFYVRKRLGAFACKRCCSSHGAGTYEARFRLVYARRISPGESDAILASREKRR